MKRTALITGASAGLGTEFARQLAAQGHDLVLIARREDVLKTVASELEQDFGVGVHTYAADLSLPDAPADIFDFCTSQNISVDYLINNAGSAGPGLLEDSGWDAQAQFFELMMTSVAQMCHRFIPGMLERRFGRVINIASFAGRIARAAGANYGPAKAYVVAMSEELAMETNPQGVHVSALCPGFTHTNFHEVAGLQEMKAGMSTLLWYDAETVVREGLDAVERGRAIYISGRLYRWLDPFAQSVWTRPLFKKLAPGR
jgi:short-subunit dehydrogenase